MKHHGCYEDTDSEVERARTERAESESFGGFGLAPIRVEGGIMHASDKLSRGYPLNRADRVYLRLDD